MKGLLYAGFLLNKIWFVWGGIAALLGIVLGVGVQFAASGTVAVIQSLMPVVPAVILSEWLARDFAENLNNCFADYSLAAGISKGEYTLSLLLKNLLTCAAGCGTAAVMLTVYRIAGADVSGGSFMGYFKLIFFVYMLEWIYLLFVIRFKNVEKAGLVCALIVALFLFLAAAVTVLILSGVGGSFRDDVVGKIVRLVSEVPLWSFSAGLAVVYAVFYFILFARIKRGDVC